jgi:hypothetical protein
VGAAVLFYGLASVMMAFVKDFGLLNSLNREQGLAWRMLDDPAVAQSLMSDLFKPGFAPALLWTLLLLTLAGLISLAMLLRPRARDDVPHHASGPR